MRLAYVLIYFNNYGIIYYMNMSHSMHNTCTMCILHACNLVHMYTHDLALIMRNAYTQALCSHMYLVRIPRLDHMNLVYVYICDSRRDHDMMSRSPKLMMHRSRSCLVEN